MNEVTKWTFGATEVRTIEMNSEPWWVLKDVCAVLDIKNHKDAATRLEDDEKGVASIDTLGGVQNMTIINESGLYSVILRSDKPQAKQFRKWVTSEVLPAIRKTGSYTAKPVDELKAKRLEIMERNATARQAMVLVKIAKMGLSQASIECLANGASMLMLGQKILPDPVVEETWSAKEVGKMLGVSGNMIGRLANANAVKCDQYGIRVLDTAKNGKQIPTFRYNKAGVERLRELVSNDE